MPSRSTSRRESGTPGTESPDPPRSGSDPLSEFIEKPMTPENLLRKVREVLGKKRV
jgi:hypothetical protein